MVSILLSTAILAMAFCFLSSSSALSLPASMSGCSHWNAYVRYRSVASPDGPSDMMLLMILPSCW